MRLLLSTGVTMDTSGLFLLYVLLAYIIGSICSAIIVSQIFGLADPRLEGSLNPGATNILRLAGKKYAMIVLLADALKGALPVLFAKAMGASTLILAFTGLAAVLGHIYPIFFRFKGGKGVASALGALIGFNFYLGLMVVATWILVATISRYSSLSSLTAIFMAPFYTLMIQGSSSAFIPLFLIALVVIFKHHKNIKRLLNGDEPKIGLKRKNSAQQK